MHILHFEAILLQVTVRPNYCLEIISYVVFYRGDTEILGA